MVMSKEVQQMLKDFETLPPEYRRCLLQMADALVELAQKLPDQEERTT
jgi:hypothetical protein